MRTLLTSALCAALLSCGPGVVWAAPAPDAADMSKPATEHTRAAHAAMSKEVDFADRQDFQDAQRGFLAPLPDRGRILDANGRETWNLAPYDFLAPAMSRDFPPSVIMPTQAPDTVNPSLWRQSQLVLRDGLYKVVDRLYQIRNADLSNMTIIEGDSGIIVVDPLISAENAAAALKLYYAHRPHKPVVAVIYSHSHVDHYGGVHGVVDEKDVAAGKVRIIAPGGFMEAAVAENVLAGNAMSRRAQYMYGSLLPPSPRGHVGAGLGLATSRGTSGLLEPTRLIEKDGETLQLDGLTFIFQMAPNTEAPAEMHWYIPELKALTAAENCTHTMHNLYTLRGAKARDPLCWSRALDESLQRWGGEAEVLYGMHHWPVWGAERVRTELGLMRDLYRYINDQTLHLANKGQTMLEIAETLRLPPELQRVFSLRGYYGSLNHNAKAVYNYYLGWFDGNPAHLHMLAPVEAARELAADALEQLGYQAESAPWRNFYLSGARDLRGLPPAVSANAASPVNTQARAMPAALYFAYLGVRLDGIRAQDKTLDLLIRLTDTQEGWELHLANSVLTARRADRDRRAPLLTCTRLQMMALFEGRLTPEQAVQQGLLQNAAPVKELLSLLDSFRPDFQLVLP